LRQLELDTKVSRLARIEEMSSNIMRILFRCSDAQKLSCCHIIICSWWMLSN